MNSYTSFKINKYSSALSDERVNQLLNANTAKEAYRTNQKGLWSRFCDYFCLGSERKTVRALFNAIVNPEQGINPTEHLNRFKKLASYATTGNFSAFAFPGMDLNTWAYEFRIDRSVIYKSQDRNEAPEHDVRKNFGLELFAWNVQNDFPNMIGGTVTTSETAPAYTQKNDANGKVAQEKDANGEIAREKEKFVRDEIECLSDCRNNDTDKIQSDNNDGTSRAYLIKHLSDDFFSSANFKEIKTVETVETVEMPETDGTVKTVSTVSTNVFFDAVFNKNGEERVLRLSNRNATNGEFRSKIAQDAFKHKNYNNLKELLGMNYGTNKDTDLKYFCNAYFMNLKSLLGSEILKDPQAIETLSSIKLQRKGAKEAISIADFIVQEKQQIDQEKQQINNSWPGPDMIEC